ncbi:MAG: dihydrodipicolinate synthase family protein [Kiloniellales bacterium]
MTGPKTFAGVLAPVVTPFAEDLSVDRRRFLAHCRWLLDEGINGLAVFGTTSEANSLSGAERRSLLEALVEDGVDPALLMPGTGCCAQPDTVRLTAHAVGLGCGGVLLLPPFYYKGVSDDGLFASVAETIERAGDARLRIYLYHIPPIAQVGYSLDLVERLRKRYPETVVGLKDSSGAWSNTAAILERFPGFATFVGSETYLLDCLRGGGAGSITAAGNVNAAALRALYDKWQDPEADALQARITAQRKVLQAYPVFPAVKALLAAMLGDPEWARMRPPLAALPAEQAAAMVEDLRRLDFPLAA